MSFKCILDVALFLERFRNIDLYQQGLYCLKFTLSHKTKSRVIHGHPYDCSKADFMDLNVLHALVSPKTEEADHSFSTSTFLIRYTEEEAILRELCVFRLEIDSHPLDSEGETTLDVGLLYSELDGDLDPSTLQMRVITIKTITFKKISSLSFRLNRPHLGLHEFVPIVFDEMHRCSVVASVHCVLLEYMLRNPELKEKVQTSSDDGENDVPRRLAKLLFFDKRKRPKLYIGAGETDQAYRSYVGVLARGHEYLRNLLDRLVLKALPTSAMIQNISLPDPLSLPYLRSPQGEVVNKFSEAVSSHDPIAVSSALLSEISTVAAQVFQMFHILLKVMKTFPVQFMRPLMEKYQERLRERYSRSVLREIHRASDHPIVAISGLEIEQRNIANERRKNPHYQAVDPFPVEFLGKTVDMPIIFEETYVADIPGEMTKVPSPRSVDENVELPAVPEVPKEIVGPQKHLFVLVHGFQGRSFDVHLLKHAISLSNPDSLVLASSANETNTEGDIFDMGEKLAAEVKAYIAEWCPRNKLAKISFLGHSLGGLIIRTALPHLTDYAGKMHMLLTMSTPHLGYMYNSSKIIDAGIWVLKKWKRSTALQQLSMSDDEYVGNTALFSMSDCAGLRWFRYVVLCSSYQDQYVPHDSARVEVSEAGANDPLRGRFYIEMASKILGQVSIERLYRLDVNFKLKGKNLDTLIGRTAHIQFLENEIFLQMLVQMYPEFFC